MSVSKNLPIVEYELASLIFKTNAHHVDENWQKRKL